MTVTWLLASLHLTALALGFWAVLSRARALRGPLDEAGLRRVFVADNLWGLAALLWLVTGLLRAFGGYEKGALHYLQNPLFHLKLGLFVLIIALEVRPMVSLIRWRIRLRRGAPVDISSARVFARLSHVQSGLVIAIVFVAAALARGMRF